MHTPSGPTQPRPVPEVLPDNIPAELRKRSQWVVWRYERRRGDPPDAKPTKVLYRADDPRTRAKSNDGATWGTFKRALEAYRDPDNELAGIGFVFSESDPYGGADFDNCIVGGEQQGWVRPYLDDFRGAYMEVSPSGNGMKVIGRFRLPGAGTRKAGLHGEDTAVELYDRRRFFTVTGDALDEISEIADVSGPAVELYRRLKPPKAKPADRPARDQPPIHLDDQELITIAGRAKNGEKFTRLWGGDVTGYPSASEADLALANLLAFYCGPDAGRIERMFNASPLGRRGKWVDRLDYRQATIATALEGRTEFYSPPAPRRDDDGEDVYPRAFVPPPEETVDIEVNGYDLSLHPDGYTESSLSPEEITSYEAEAEAHFERVAIQGEAEAKADAPDAEPARRAPKGAGGQRSNGRPGAQYGEFKRLPLTDMGNGERMVRLFGDQIRHCHPWKKWLAWDGRRWKIDATARAYRFAKTVVRSIYGEAKMPGNDKDDREAIVQWAMASEAKGHTEAMVAMASRERGIPVVPDELDRNPLLLDCRNCTIDLRTGEGRPHDRADLITKMAPVDFDPDAGCPLFMETLATFLVDDNLIAFWQRLCGMAITGIADDHILPIAYGTGSNGKSTLLGILLEALGPDYAMKAAPDLLIAKRGEAHPTDRADLFGKRVVIAIETEDGQRLNESLVKELTGGDRIRARRMREDFWEFEPTDWLEAERKLFLDRNGPLRYPPEGYVSDQLRHFVGKVNDRYDEEAIFGRLIGILKEGRLKHMGMHSRMSDYVKTGPDGSVSVGVLPPGSSFQNMTFGPANGDGPPVEFSGVILGGYTGEKFEDEVLALQMVCFCDIPREDLAIHMAKFGRFGLAFPKAFLSARGANPVFYVDRASRVREWPAGPAGKAMRDAAWERRKRSILESSAPFLDEIRRLQATPIDAGDPDAQAERRQRVEGLEARRREAVAEAMRADSEPETTREELFRTSLAEAMSLLASLRRLLFAEGDGEAQELGLAVKRLADFLSNHVISYMKPFDSWRGNTDPRSFYMEREWRIRADLPFAPGDVSEVIVPEGYGDRARRELGEAYVGKIFQHRH